MPPKVAPLVLALLALPGSGNAATGVLGSHAPIPAISPTVDAGQTDSGAAPDLSGANPGIYSLPAIQDLGSDSPATDTDDEGDLLADKEAKSKSPFITIPEPAVALLGGIGLLILLWRRK